MADTTEEKDIIVVGKRNDDSRGIWDRHPYHPSNYGDPEGEVYIADMRPYEVHRSRGIQQKLGEKELQELGEKAATQRRSDWQDAEDKRQAARTERMQARRDQMIPEGATAIRAGVVPTERNVAVQAGITPQGGLDASAHPNTAIENDPGGVGDTENDDPNTQAEAGRTATVRRPAARGGDKPER